MGFSYAVIAVGMIGYAWLMQERRRHRIITRYGGHHGPFPRSSTPVSLKLTPLTFSDEIYGPVVVVALIFVAVLVNFILRVNQRFVFVFEPCSIYGQLTSLAPVGKLFVITLRPKIHGSCRSI